MTKRRIFLTGASGAMGQAVTRALVAGGHAVVGAVRSPAGADAVTRVSNRRFRDVAGWAPRHRSARDGWAEVAAAARVRAPAA